MTKNKLNTEREKFSHYIIEIFDFKDIFNKDVTNKALELIKKLNLKVVKSATHNYVPHGATTMFILSSSHLIIHTWPEYDYAHIDLFSCSNAKTEEEIHTIIQESFKHANAKIKKMNYDK